jgi:flagellar assembly protein FliH
MAIIRSRSALGEGGAAGAGLEKAMRDTETKLAQAREEGRQAGLKEAAARIAAAEERAAANDRLLGQAKIDLEQQFIPVLQAMVAAAESIEELQAKTVASAEVELVKLAVAVAERVLRRQIELDPTWMHQVVQEALRQIPDRRQVVLRLNPQDAGLAREHQRTLTANIPNLMRLEIVDDNSLDRGACVLESTGTTLDASLISSAQRVGEELLQSAPPGPYAVTIDPENEKSGPA